MIRGLLFSAGALGVLFACVDTDQADPLQQVPTVPAANSDLARSLPMDFTPVAASAVPEVTYPENRAVHIERIVRIYDATEASFREELYSDGDGQIQLNVLEYMSARAGGWGEVPAESQMMYESRDHFLMKYRDVHLGHPTAYAANYNWFVDAKPHEVAGRVCTMWAARSTHGFGGTDLLIDDETGLLLGWTVYGPNLKPQIQAIPSEVDFDPDLSDVQWHAGAAHSEGFTYERDGEKLGFKPRVPDYVPEGFYLEREAMAYSGIDEAPTVAHVALYQDGLRPLFVVQSKAPVGDDERDQFIIDTVRRSKFGGIELVEGVHGGLELYVMSGLNSDELHTVFGSLMQ